MQFAYIFTISGVLLASLVFVWGSPIESQSPIVTPQQFKYVGNVGGKLYFLEEARNNWESAYKSCNDSGMHLATVETLEESRFLLQALDNAISHWVSAREISRSNFELAWEWQGETGDVDRTIFSSIDYFEERRCMAVDKAGSDGLLHGQMISCTSTYPYFCELRA